MKWSGDKISFEVFGTSHAPEIGVVAKGLPGRPVNEEGMAAFLARRKAKNSVYSTKRIEADVPAIEQRDLFRAVIRTR